MLELGFAGIHAVPLRLAGFDVTVVEPDAAHRARARQRADEVFEAVPTGDWDAVIAPDGVEAPPAQRVIRVGQDGSVWSSASS